MQNINVDLAQYRSSTNLATPRNTNATFNFLQPQPLQINYMPEEKLELCD